MPQLLPERGFLTSRQMIARYAERSPRDLSRLGWYVGFGYFKLAVVAEGIHHRFLAGKTVGAGFDHFGDAVPLLLNAALLALGDR
jgi:aminoglycoside phosphotransferase (APT) family kinase protein